MSNYSNIDKIITDSEKLDIIYELLVKSFSLLLALTTIISSGGLATTSVLPELIKNFQHIYKHKFEIETGAIELKNLIMEFFSSIKESSEAYQEIKENMEPPEIVGLQKQKTLMFIYNINTISLLFKNYYNEYLNILIEYKTNKTETGIDIPTLDYCKYIFNFNLSICLNKFYEAFNIKSLKKIQDKLNTIDARKLYTMFGKYLAKTINNENELQNCYIQLNLFNNVLNNIKSILGVNKYLEIKRFTNDTKIVNSHVNNNVNPEFKEITRLYYDISYFDLNEYKKVNSITDMNSINILFINNTITEYIVDILIKIKQLSNNSNVNSAKSQLINNNISYIENIISKYVINNKDTNNNKIPNTTAIITLLRTKIFALKQYKAFNDASLNDILNNLIINYLNDQKYNMINSDTKITSLEDLNNTSMKIDIHKFKVYVDSQVDKYTSIPTSSGGYRYKPNNTHKLKFSKMKKYKLTHKKL